MPMKAQQGGNYLEAAFFISLNGNDNWSGKSASPNKNKTDGPFATISKARDAIRRMKKDTGLKAPVTVMVRGGTYYLKKTLFFTPEDTGTAEVPITYTAYPGERVIISGGIRIRKWKETNVNGKKMWVVTVPGPGKATLEIRELFVNGERRRRPRIPKEGFYQIADFMGVDESCPVPTPQDSFRFASGDIKPWKNLIDVEVVVLHFWAESHLRIKGIDSRKRIVYFQNKTRRRFKERHGKPTKYYVENVFEAIQPGEWYLEKKSGRLYYMPLKDEKLSDAQVIIPKLEDLIVIQGKPSEGRYVEHLHFENFSFSHTQVAFEKIAVSMQAAWEVPGAIRWEGARNCSIQQCEISRIGTYAIELCNGCCGNHIVGNHVFDMGAGGIKVNGTATPTNSRELTLNNVISDNYIHHGGKIAHCAVGILICHSGGNTVIHNHIHDLYYTGISIGWTWGYQTDIVSTNNLIEYNHIHDLGHNWLSDMGGIYTLGLSTGTKLRRNLIHDVRCYVYGGWGIYFDVGTRDIVAEENIVYNCQTGVFHQHYGRDNIVQNNIFGPSEQHHLERTREEDHLSFTFRHNIFYIRGGKFLNGNWFRPGYIFEQNLYWRADRKKLKFLDLTFKQWQERGQDLNSLVADPMFRDPDNGDFTLSPDSPAFKLGFRPIDMSEIGLTPASLWTPVQNRNRKR